MSKLLDRLALAPIDVAVRSGYQIIRWASEFSTVQGSFQPTDPEPRVEALTRSLLDALVDEIGSTLAAASPTQKHVMIRRLSEAIDRSVFDRIVLPPERVEALLDSLRADRQAR